MKILEKPELLETVIRKQIMQIAEIARMKDEEAKLEREMGEVSR